MSRDTVSGPSESAISVCQSLNQLTCPDCLHQIEDISPKSSNPPYPQWGGSGRYFWLPVPSMYPSGGDWLVISEEISVTVFTERDLLPIGAKLRSAREDLGNFYPLVRTRFRFGPRLLACWRPINYLTAGASRE